jgi:hypothetical protein
VLRQRRQDIQFSERALVAVGAIVARWLRAAFQQSDRLARLQSHNPAWGGGVGCCAGRRAPSHSRGRCARGGWGDWGGAGRSCWAWGEALQETFNLQQDITHLPEDQGKRQLQAAEPLLQRAVACSEKGR